MTTITHLTSLPECNLPLIGSFTWLTPPGPYRATTCRGREWTCGSHTYFLITQGHGGPPGMRVQLNAEATYDTAQTEKTIHTRHTPIHSSKANMKWWLWRPNDIRGPCGAKVSWHLSYRWGKTPKRTSPKKHVQTGDRTRARSVTGAHATACSTAVNQQ